MLGVRIDSLSHKDLREKLTEYLVSDHFHHIATVNPEFLVEANKNKVFRDILRETALNVCDGFGIVLLSRILNQQKINRITGVELAEMLCATAAQEGQSVFFLGGRGVAQKAAEALQKKYPSLKIAGALDGGETTIKEVQEARPAVVLVAFGAPKQEYWIAEKGPQIPGLKIAVGVGGTFDFWAGKVPRAPQIMRRLGLEWLFRLATEPRKRIRRIIRAVFLFPFLAIKERFTAPK